ncbi:MAG TPA: beta-galactosidase GalA [Candidatus Limnocylindrales bacterium]|nr:beta-galactosidase GalA [Candidatus Limnocylindrales bacterium]
MRLTRRDLLKTCVAASAAAALPDKSTVTASAIPNVHSAASQSASAAPPSPDSTLRERLLLDFGWRFHLGDADDASKDFAWGELHRGGALFSKSLLEVPVLHERFDDSSWRSLDLPHDWAVELPFRNIPNLQERGAHPLGREFPDTSIGWYRRVFDLSASDEGRRISFEFDGMFRNAIVLFNGHYMGVNFSGYAPYRCDVTDFANYGAKNVLVVRVDATEGEGWFYEGAGIYRHVWLEKTGPLHFAHHGVYVRSEVHSSAATVFVSMEIENETAKPAACRVVSHILDAAGKTVATAESAPATISPFETRTVEARATIEHPALWSLEERNLYRAVCSLENSGAAADRDSATFGIRTVHFDADKGFFLNGKRVEIKGTCNHQDHAGVGSALPDRLQYYRIERLKEMGCNGYRTSHNPPTPELLDACDRLGMLVLDETRMMSSTPEGLSELERMIRRDRNHPSIFLWSLGNEEPDQGTPRGARIVSTMKELARKLDPSRLVTVAMNGSWGKGISGVVDVQGFNYGYAGGAKEFPHNGGRIDEFHKQFPKQPSIGTETASDFATRGIYVNDPDRGYVSAYDVNFPHYAISVEDWWKVYAEREFLSGCFAWTGFDYRGEPSPYGWPCVSSHFGIMDTCGFPKDTYYYYQSWWTSQPVLHLFPHWNWPGKEGTEIDVWCFTNLDSVELFLNGASLGSKNVERNSHVQWKVKYAPGVIAARGMKDGKVVLVDKRETTGNPAKIVLRPDRLKIAADGEDVSVVVVEIQDAQGRVMPTASNDVRFKVSGAGRLIGVGNGDPSSHESDKGNNRSAFNGLCCAIVQSLKSAGEIRVDAASDGLAPASATITASAATVRPSVT